jgi:hypothetical protein
VTFAVAPVVRFGAHEVIGGERHGRDFELEPKLGPALPSGSRHPVEQHRRIARLPVQKRVAPLYRTT